MAPTTRTTERARKAFGNVIGFDMFVFMQVLGMCKLHFYRPSHSRHSSVVTAIVDDAMPTSTPARWLTKRKKTSFLCVYAFLRYSPR